MKKNKILAFGIVLCMLFSLAVAPVGAETYGYYTYSVIDGESGITAVNKSISGNVTIPSTLGGYPVKYIGAGAFEDCTSLTSITIPDTIVFIGGFDGCCNLTSINVSENNPNYSSLDGILFSNDRTRLIECPEGKTGTITIPDGVRSFSKGFNGCTGITSIVIPNSVTTIERFSRCTSLTSITIPDSATRISYNAFSGCISLSSIIIPDSVTRIEQRAFENCTSLTDVYYGGNEDDWNKISIGITNDDLTNATIHYNHVSSKHLTNVQNNNGETLTLIEDGVFDIGENLYFRNGYVNATNGYIKAGDKKITGENIYFTNEGKIRLGAGYTAKVERDNGDDTTDQGFMAGIINPNRVITMTLEITGTANDVDYTGKTISKDFDFTNYEVSGLVNFGFTVNNIPKPLELSIKSY